MPFLPKYILKRLLQSLAVPYITFTASKRDLVRLNSTVSRALEERFYSKL